ncbi:hypothetical protein NPIL_255731 [Nephila pilipes]|uniref:Uncharacterized protein n=1 Tax=Nephila pilipes TaxID=299642 RepID=A0A8X6NUE6_NEPPI|nr:hypothetical protein NPIL_255731 [Nephila pilipes]
MKCDSYDTVVSGVSLGCSFYSRPALEGGVLKMGQRRVCRLSPFRRLRDHVCVLECDLLWRSLFETVSMASGCLQCCVVRGNGVFARSLRACRGGIFRHSSVEGKSSWNLLGFL